MTKPPTGGFFIYHCQYRECMRTSCRPTACDEKGITYGMEAMVRTGC